MKFIGITRDFSLINENQYATIGAFWDELSELYGLENLILLTTLNCSTNTVESISSKSI